MYTNIYIYSFSVSERGLISRALELWYTKCLWSYFWYKTCDTRKTASRLRLHWINLVKVLKKCKSAFLWLLVTFYPDWLVISCDIFAMLKGLSALNWLYETAQDWPNLECTYLQVHVYLSRVSCWFPSGLVPEAKELISWVWLDKTACLSIGLDN